MFRPMPSCRNKIRIWDVPKFILLNTQATNQHLQFYPVGLFEALFFHSHPQIQETLRPKPCKPNQTQTYTTSKRCAFDKVFSHFIPSGEGHEKSKIEAKVGGNPATPMDLWCIWGFVRLMLQNSGIHSPVEVGSLSHYLQGFIHCLEFCPSTVGWAKWQKVLKIGVAPYKSSATRALGRRISTKLRCFPLSRFGFSYLSAVWQVVTINAVYVFLTHIGWQITNNGQSIKSCNASIHSMVNLHLISPAIKEIEIESRNTSHTFHSNKSVRYLTLRKLHEKIWNIF